MSVPPRAPAPVAAVVPQARAFTLNADTLFDFDLAILRPGAEQALFDAGTSVDALMLRAGQGAGKMIWPGA